MLLQGMNETSCVGLKGVTGPTALPAATAASNKLFGQAFSA